jgi:hypothetical protein
MTNNETNDKTPSYHFYKVVNLLKGFLLVIAIIMGINGSHTLTYSIGNLTVQQLFAIGLYIYNKYNSHIIRLPTIYIDASWIIRLSTTNDNCRVGYLLRLACHLVSTGFRVVIVCDGSVRHHSKRSTTKRWADIYSSRIMLHHKHIFLMSLLAKKNASDSIEERANFDNAIKAVSAKISSVETQIKKSKIDVGTACYEKIVEEIKQLNMDPAVLTAVQAEFQADSVLAGAVVKSEADIILSADSDLAALLGDKCISIKNYKFTDRTKTKTLKGMELFSADYSTIHDITTHLGIPTENIIMAKRPVFEGITDMKVRCLIAVGLGCASMVYLALRPKLFTSLLRS